MTAVPLSTDALPESEPSPGFDHRVRVALTLQREMPAAVSFCADIANLQEILPKALRLESDGTGNLSGVFTGENGRTLSWTGSFSIDRGDNSISWLSTADSEIKAKGEITFREASGGKSTELCLLLDYVPPSGGFRRFLSQDKDPNPPISVKKVLQNLRALIECGEVATILGQSHGE